MEFLRSFLRRHLAGKPVVASPNVACFRRLGAHQLLLEMHAPFTTFHKDSPVPGSGQP